MVICMLSVFKTFITALSGVTIQGKNGYVKQPSTQGFQRGNRALLSLTCDVVQFFISRFLFYVYTLDTAGLSHSIL